MPARRTTTRTTSPRRKAVKEETVQTESTPSVREEIREIRKERNYIPLLVIAILLLSFLLGMAFMKIQYLEKGGTVAQAGTNAQGANQQAAPTGPAAKVNVANGHFPVMGNDNAKVTIVEFADPRCPFCKQFHDQTLPQLKSDYIDTGKVKMYFRNYDFLGPASTVAGNALECANEQGKFWDLEDYFYTNQPDESDTSMYNTDSLTTIAGNLGMDTNQFNSCLSSNKYNKNVSADMADGQKAGVTGTPTFFIDGISLVGAQPYSAFKTVIDQELAK